MPLPLSMQCNALCFACTVLSLNFRKNDNRIEN
jgi:hypothetical protein